MIFEEVEPCDALKPFIESFYYYDEVNEAHREETIIANGTIEMRFELGTGWCQVKRGRIFANVSKVQLWGQVTKPITVIQSGHSKIIGLRFYTHAAAYFIDAPVSEITDKVADASDFFDECLDTIHNKLCGQHEFAFRIQALQDWLSHRVSLTEKPKKNIDFIASVITRLNNGSFNARVIELSYGNNISYRYLNQLFLRYTGITPKLFNKIKRFQHSLKLISHPEMSLTEVAYDAGFFDQSHFIREFRSFTGMTPRAYLQHAKLRGRTMTSR